MLLRIACIIVLLLLPCAVFGQSEVDLSIRSTFANRIPLAIAQFAAVDGAAAVEAAELEQLVFLDLQFSGFFKIVRGQVPVVTSSDAGLVEVRGMLIQNGSEMQFEGRVLDRTEVPFNVALTYHAIQRRELNAHPGLLAEALLAELHLSPPDHEMRSRLTGALIEAQAPDGGFPGAKTVDEIGDPHRTACIAALALARR